MVTLGRCTQSNSVLTLSRLSRTDGPKSMQARSFRYNLNSRLRSVECLTHSSAKATGLVSQSVSYAKNSNFPPPVRYMMHACCVSSQIWPQLAGCTPLHGAVGSTVGPPPVGPIRMVAKQRPWAVGRRPYCHTWRRDRGGCKSPAPRHMPTRADPQGSRRHVWQ